MIAGLLHSGSGLGNQLHRYIMLRCLALDKGLKFGMVAPENFKGKDFMNLDMGEPMPFNYHTEMPAGKVVVETDWPLFVEDNSDYDWKGINSIQDNTVVDGEFQGEMYFYHHLREMKKWLKVKLWHAPQDLCVINFRGGEYKYFPELYLTKDYWDLAISKMKEIDPFMKFEVHTDDPIEAAKFFPEFNIIHNIGQNWRAVRFAKYLILSNSSFAILPAILNKNAKKIIAPKGWARRNVGEQFQKYNVYRRFNHI
jgi:hypothetical protein